MAPNFLLLERAQQGVEKHEGLLDQYRLRRRTMVLAHIRDGVSPAKLAEVLALPEGTVRNMAAAAAREESQ